MTSDQVLMAAILIGVGGLFLLCFLLVRRLLDARRDKLEQRLAAGVSDSATRHGPPSVRRSTKDPGIGAGDSAVKLGGDSGTLRTGSGSGLRQAGGTLQASAKDTGGALLVESSMLDPGEGITHRVDRAFNRIVDRSGLQWTPEQALGIVCLVGVLAAAGAYVWREELWISLVALILGLAVSLGVLMYLQAKWQKLLQEQMPDAFFFLARSLRAGLSFEQALAAGGAQGARPLADELRRAAERVRLGLPIPTALELAAKRINLLDFNVFVSVVALHQTTGGNLALQLDRLATSVRDRNQYRGYFRSATALGRISAIAIGAAVPLIFLGYALFQPEYALRFFESAAGITMLITAFALEIIGVLWLYALLKASY
jgi:tight adherence protein B